MSVDLKSPLVRKAGSALIVFALGVLLTAYFIATKKETHRKEDKKSPLVLVETQRFAPQDHVLEISALGQVKPALETALRAQVSGEIIAVSPDFAPGGFFEKGAQILRIDPAAYALDVKKKETLVKRAQADLSLEMGRQDIARDEMEILRKTTGARLENTDLALRKPQLDQAVAARDQAIADLEIAQLNLDRTTLKAPFNALVAERTAGPGDIVSAQTTLARLVGTDEYWVEISVPVHDMAYLNLPDAGGKGGSPARIVLDAGRGSRDGKLIRMTGSLDAQSRLVTMLVSVPDPLFLKARKRNTPFGFKTITGTGVYTQINGKPPLVLGDYVQVILHGKTMKGAIRLPLSALRDGGKVWIAKDGKLEMRTVSIAYRDRDHAYIRQGLSAQDRIIVSNIPAAVEGMALRFEDSGQAP